MTINARTLRTRTSTTHIEIRIYARTTNCRESNTGAPLLNIECALYKYIMFLRQRLVRESRLSVCEHLIHFIILWNYRAHSGCRITYKVQAELS